MQPKLCILAGAGHLPSLLIKACETASRPFVVIAFRGQAKPEDFASVPNVSWHRLGAGRAILDEILNLGVREVILAGAIRRPGLVSLWPDFWTLRKLLRSKALNRGDDGLLRFVASLFEGDGIQVVGVPDVAPELLTPTGQLTICGPDDDAANDVKIAREAAKELGRMDVGQAVVARSGRIIAHEDRRGTDVMLRRIENPGVPTGVLAKCIKPGQDRRMDLPAIGVDTVRNASLAGLRGIAVDAGASLIIERDATLDAANDAGIFIIGVDDE